MDILNDLNNPICAVVLASGSASRMHKNKLLLPLNQRMMVDYALQMAALPVFHKAFVVTCYPEVEALANQRGMSVVWNTHANNGQSASVVLGAKAVGDTESAAVMFFNGDMPYLQPDTVLKLVKAFYDTGRIIVPTYGKRPGNPVLFPSCYIPELMTLTGDVGGRKVLRAHPEAVVYVPVESVREGMDLDDEIRYKEAEAYFNEHQ